MGGEQKNQGIYGGVGSKAAPPVWTPAVSRDVRPAEAVPRRFRGLRLRRRRSRMEPTPPHVLIPVGVVALGLLFLLYRLVFHS